MLGWLFGKDLKTVLSETKKITVDGIRFEIKKVNVLNYLDGSKVLLNTYDIHKTAKAKEAVVPPNVKEIEKHYKQVLVAGVVSPALSLEEKEGCILVDELFTYPGTVEKLYTQIMVLTYGKKKVKQLISAGKSASS